MMIVPNAAGKCPSCQKIVAEPAPLPVGTPQQQQPQPQVHEQECILCGRHEDRLCTFIVRVQSAIQQGTSTKFQWHNSTAKCCGNCFTKISSLETINFAMTLLIFVPAMFAAVVWYMNPATLRTVWSLIPLLTAIVGVMGSLWVAARRKELVSNEHFAETRKNIEAFHRVSTGTGTAQVIPLTTTGGLFEAFR